MDKALELDNPSQSYYPVARSKYKTLVTYCIELPSMTLRQEGGL